MSINLIFETKYWNIFLTEDQMYLGRAVVDLKRNSPSLSSITSEEFTDFHLVIKKYEHAVTEAFDATMFNWSCLMNNAYKLNPPKPHVHWHCRPRYNSSVEFYNEAFLDPNFGHHYDKDMQHNVSQEIQEKIIQKIQQFIL